MKIQIKDLEPNPFRDMGSYPIEDAKIQALVNSISETGFWDNVVVRKSPNNGKYQIAYGHHRLMALKKIKKLSDCVDLPVKDLDDSTMLRVMANENDSTWGINVKVDDETVRAAKKFLEEHLDIARKYRSSPIGEDEPHSIGEKTISRFLGKNWKRDRVARSLERLKMEGEKKLSRPAVNILPTEGTARVFVKAVKDIKPSLAAQYKVAKKIASAEKSEGLTSPETIHAELLHETLAEQGITKRREKEDKTTEFIDVIKDINQQMRSLGEKLGLLIQYQKDFDSDIYFKTIERMAFIANAQSLIRRLNTLLKGGNNGKELSKSTT